MRDDDVNPKTPNDNSKRSRVSRHDFLKISGISVAVPLVAGPRMVVAAGEKVPVYGPGKVPMEFAINGKNYKADLEPRVTLLDALRDQFELTEPSASAIARMRGLHRANGQQNRLRLFSPCYRGPAQTDRHCRIVDARRQAASGATGVRGERCLTVRLLHAGICGLL